MKKKILSLILSVCMALGLVYVPGITVSAQTVAFSAATQPLTSTNNPDYTSKYMLIEWNTDDAVVSSVSNDNIYDSGVKITFCEKAIQEVLKISGWSNYLSVTGYDFKLYFSPDMLKNLNSKATAVVRVSGAPLGANLFSEIGSARSFGGSIRFYYCDASGNKTSDQLFGSALKIGQKMSYPDSACFTPTSVYYPLQNIDFEAMNEEVLPTDTDEYNPVLVYGFTKDNFDASLKFVHFANGVQGSEYSSYITNASVTDTNGNSITGVEMVGLDGNLTLHISPSVYDHISTTHLPLKITVWANTFYSNGGSVGSTEKSKTRTITFTRPTVGFKKSLSNLSLSLSSDTYYKQAISGTITPADGYSLPKNITIKRNNVVLSGIKYNSQTGVFSINKSDVTGDFEIIAEGCLEHFHGEEGYKKWTNSSSLPTTAGNYVLETDLTLSGVWNVPSGVTNLCLNGKVINLNSKNIVLKNGATLNIYDCSDTVRYYDADSTTGKWTLKTDGTSDYTTTGGIITGGSAALGGAIAVHESTLNLYGGNIVGNEASSNNGGGIYTTDSTLLIDGANILGNYAFCSGGGVFAHNTAGTLNSGNISYNRACITDNNGGDGGGLYLSGCTTTINDCNITHNTNLYDGGGIMNSGGGTLTINGGTISDNTTTFWGEWSDYCGGAGICNDSESTLILNDGTICDNTGVSNGGGVFNRGTFNMNGGTIEGNICVSLADNIYKGYGDGVANETGAEFNMTGGYIGVTHNELIKDDTCRGVYNKGTFTMTGGEIFASSDDESSCYALSNSATYNSDGTEASGAVANIGENAVITGQCGYKPFAINATGTINLSGNAVVTARNINDCKDNRSRAVYLSSGTLNISGSPEIVALADENSSNAPDTNGIRFEPKVMVNISGSPKIVADTSHFQAEGTPSEPATHINIVGKLKKPETPYIVVKRSDVDLVGGCITYGWARYMSDADPDDYFTGADSFCAVLQETELYLTELCKFTITAEATEGGVASGSKTVKENSNVTLTAEADEGYEFVGWFDGDELVCEDEEFVVEKVTEDKTYIARFEVIGQEPVIPDDVQPVCYIDSEGYTSLAEAVSAAKDGDVIWMVADDNYSTNVTIDKNLIIELEGHTLKSVCIKFDGNINVKLNDRVGTAVLNSDCRAGYEITADFSRDSRPRASFYLTGGANVIVSGKTGGTKFYGGTAEGLPKAFVVGQGCSLTVNGGTMLYEGNYGSDGIFVCDTGVLTLNDILIDRYTSYKNGSSLSYANVPTTENPLKIKKGHFYGGMWVEGSATINGVSIFYGTLTFNQIEKALLYTSEGSYIDYDKSTNSNGWEIFIASDKLSTDTDIDNDIDSTEVLRVSAGGDVVADEGQKVVFQPQITGGDGVNEIEYTWFKDGVDTGVTTSSYSIEAATKEDSGTYVFTATQGSSSASCEFKLSVLSSEPEEPDTPDKPEEVSIPELSFDGEVLTLVDKSEIALRVGISYVGSAIFDEKNVDWNRMVFVGKKYEEINGESGYRTYENFTSQAFNKAGNYVSYVKYAIGEEVSSYYYLFTVAGEAESIVLPYLTFSDNTLTMVNDMGISATVGYAYVGAEVFNSSKVDWNRFVEVGKQYSDINTERGYVREVDITEFSKEFSRNGNYVAYIKYNDPNTGKSVSEYTTFTVDFVPVVTADRGRIVVEANGNDLSKITIAYIGDSDKKITDWTSFAQASNIYKEINGDPQKQQYSNLKNTNRFGQDIDGYYAVYVRYGNEVSDKIVRYYTIYVDNTDMVVKPVAQGSQDGNISIIDEGYEILKTTIAYVGTTEKTVYDWNGFMEAANVFKDINGDPPMQQYFNIEQGKLFHQKYDGYYIVFIRYDDEGSTLSTYSTVWVDNSNAVTPEITAENGRIVLSDNGVDVQKVTIAYIGEADKEICNWTQFATASNAYKEINGDPQKQQYHTPSDGSEFVQNLDGWYAVYIRYTDENGKAVSIYKTINVTDTALVVRPEAVANGADIVINANGCEISKVTIAYIGDEEKKITNWNEFSTASNVYKDINGDPQKQQYHNPKDAAVYTQNQAGYYAVYLRYTAGGVSNTVYSVVYVEV